MEEFIERLADHAGIDQESAEKVVDFLRDHATELPGLLGGGGIMGTMSGFLGGKSKAKNADVDSEDGSAAESDDDDENADDK